MTIGKWVRFVFLACPVNPCKDFALSTYNVGILREHLSLGMTQISLKQYVQNRRLERQCRCIHLRYMYKHIIQKAFSHEVALDSENCQNLKDETRLFKA